jgi:bud site selection protein 31
LKNNYADKNLIAKWKKQGYEKVSYIFTTLSAFQTLTVLSQLCCLRCIQTKETNFNSTCICRVPRKQLKEDQIIECVNCGCRGCGSSD